MCIRSVLYAKKSIFIGESGSEESYCLYELIIYLLETINSS